MIPYLSKPKISRRIEVPEPHSYKRQEYLIPDQILSVLCNIPFGGDAFEPFYLCSSQLLEVVPEEPTKRIQVGPEKEKLSGILFGRSVYEYVRDKMEFVCRNMKNIFMATPGWYNAQLLSCAVSTVAEVISRSRRVNLPRLRTQIATQLLDAFKDYLKLVNEDGFITDETLNFTQLLVGNDPIGLYAKQLITVEEAARMIKDLAKEMNVSPLHIYNMLYIQFVSGILATKGGFLEPDDGGDEGRNFPQSELYGEISPLFYQFVTGQISVYRVSENHVVKGGFQEHMSVLYLALSRGMISKKLPIPLDLAYDYICEHLKVDRSQAVNILAEVEKYMASLPILITVKAKDWFDHSRMILSPEYKSRFELHAREEQSSNIVSPDYKNTITTLGPYNESAERGPRYERWRLDKDTRGAGKLLSFAELPKFGCLCVWDMAKFQSGCTVDDYYGDMNLFINPERVLKRVYRFKDSGLERRTFSELFVDMIQDKSDMAGVLLAAAMRMGHIPFGIHKTLEVIIYDNLNVNTDVMLVTLKPSVPKDLLMPIRRWASDNSIACFTEENLNWAFCDEFSIEMHDLPVMPVLTSLVRLNECVHTLFMEPLWNNASISPPELIALLREMPWGNPKFLLSVKQLIGSWTPRLADYTAVKPFFSCLQGLHPFGKTKKGVDGCIMELYIAISDLEIYCSS